MRLLVVEDDVRMASLLQRALVREGYAVDVVSNGVDAIWSGREVPYDAVLLDAMIPEPDGFDVCRQLRAAGRWMPVIMLTARDAVDDRVRGLDAGADDYLAKPFELAELHARLRALLRRDPRERPAILVAGTLMLDPATRHVSRGEAPIELSAKEFALLELLMRHKGDVLSRSAILDHVWDDAYDGTSNVVDVYVRYVREKIDRPSAPAPSRRSAGPATGSAPTAGERWRSCGACRCAPGSPPSPAPGRWSCWPPARCCSTST